MQDFDRLIKVFRVVFEENIDAAAITPAASLREDVGIDSIGLLYMAMAVEEEFGIKFTKIQTNKISIFKRLYINIERESNK